MVEGSRTQKGRFKGLVLLNAQSFCRERFGDAGWTRVLDALGPEDRGVMEGAVHVGWYPIGLYDRLHEAIDRELGDGHFTLMRPLGHYCAEHDLTKVHRVFFRMASPSFLMARYGEFWRRYQDTGTWTVHRPSDLHVRCTLAGWASTSETTCVRLAAYVERFLALVGANGVHLTRTKCTARGDAVCEYDAKWSSTGAPIS